MTENAKTAKVKISMASGKDHEFEMPLEKATLGPLLTMDPDKEEFTGPPADQANKMLTKKYRKGFVIEGAETL